MPSRRIVVPVRHHHEIERRGRAATLLLMPAWTGAAAGRLSASRSCPSFPTTARGACRACSAHICYGRRDRRAARSPRRRPSDAVAHGRRLGAGGALPRRARTRARMVMVGAGALAPFLIRAHLSQRPIARGHALEPTPRAAPRRSPPSSRREGCRSRPTDDLEAAVREADLVSCATLSDRPAREGRVAEARRPSRPRRRLQPQMREADDEALGARASIVDTRGGAARKAATSRSRCKAGAHRGGPHAQAPCSTSAAARPGRQSGRARSPLFKSVGTALEDLAAAMLVWRGSGWASDSCA